MSSNSNLFKEGIMAGYAVGRRHGKGKILRKIFKSNGTFNAKTDPETPCDGYNPVIIALDIMPKSVTENGTYIAEEDNLDGYNQVSVNVPAPVTELSVTKNGTYRAEAPNVGFNPVKVNVPSWEDAKKFYVDQGGTGEAGTGDSDYATELMNEIGYGDYSLESESSSGWSLVYRKPPSTRYPTYCWELALVNTALGKDLWVASAPRGFENHRFRLKSFTIGERSSGAKLIIADAEVSYDEGDWQPHTNYATASGGGDRERAWAAYLAENSTCTVVKEEVW